MKALEVEHDPEGPVIEAIQQGDPQAMVELMNRHGRWVRGVIFAAAGRTDGVDDVAQRVWMQVWREARRLEDPSRWRVWLYRIARNAASDWARAERRKGLFLARLWDRTARHGQPDGDPAAKLIRDERDRAVMEAIASLPAIYREPFVLKHLEDWSYRQIGEALGLPVDTVETRLVRARRLLRERLRGVL